jgi:ankyrin repeat protein
MVPGSDFQLAWQLQIQEYLKAAKAVVAQKIDTVFCYGVPHRPRIVKGDGDCFFHAVNQPTLTRKTLVAQLLRSSGQENVRQGFAHEIRQFLYLGCVGGLNSDNDRAAFAQMVTKPFQDLVDSLNRSEEALRQLIGRVREVHGAQETAGKNAADLIVFLKSQQSPFSEQFEAAFQDVKDRDRQISELCKTENVFRSYVSNYLDRFQGFIPFSRRLEGEDLVTPIDVINQLFRINIQIFLRDGTCLTQPRNGPFIPVLHNGIDHFDGLERGARVPVSPLGVNELMAQMTLKERPPRFQMDHLLQAGHLGTRYQFLVLLSTVMELLLRKCLFTAQFEAKGHGNLDDIVIHSQDEQGRVEIRAFQVKYYVDQIKADLFFNKPTKSKTQKNAKMHIGKFFEGWLALKKQNPRNLQSVVYSNNSLDTILSACTGGKEKFEEAFITRQLKVACSLGDFYDTLFAQAKDHSGLKITPLQFQEFLRSFRFCTREKDLEPLTQSILTTLSSVVTERRDEIQVDQLFLNLYSLVEDWFCHDRKARTPPVLNNQFLEQFIKRAQLHFHDKVELQGRTKAALGQIQEGTDNRVVARGEWADLYRLMSQEGFVFVVGEKGIGKSGLVKNVLQNYRPAEYLFFSARELFENKKLKKQVNDVLSQEKEVRIVVIDAAEILLDVSPEEAKAFIRAFFKAGRAVVVTITPNALQQVAMERQSVIQINPLNPKEVLSHFPELSPYADAEPILRLICVPFYLKPLIQLKKPELDAILDQRNTPLEVALIRQVIEGRDKKVAKTRLDGWRALATHRAKGASTTALGSKLGALKEDGIVLQDNGEWDFTHDLFFEYGLIEFWMMQKTAQTALGNEQVFWEELPGFLKFRNPISVLAKWFVLGGSEIKQELLGLAEELSRKEIFKSLIGMAIVLQDQGLLNALLRYQAGVAASNNGNLILLSIVVDSPEALEAILLSRYRPPQKITEDSSEESSSTETDSTHSSEEYDLRSESDHSEHESIDSVEPSNLEVFCKNLSKYWSAGFEEEPGMFDDEGEWIYNERYQSPPDNSGLYLHQAILLDRKRCLEVLIDHQKGGIGRNNYQETPLHLAVLERKKEAVTRLLEVDGLVHTTDAWGETALHNVAYIGDFEIARQLLEQGADPNRLSEHGLTPLHIAASRLDLEIVKLFLEHKGDLAIHPFESEDVTVADLLDNLDQSRQEEMEDFVLGLIAHLGYGHEKGTEEIVEDLMTLVEHRAQISEHCPDFDYVDSDTELDYAVENGDVEKIEELQETILSDPDNIDQVLDSDGCRHLKEELVNGWMESCNDEQFENLKIYAAVYEDEEVQKFIEGYADEVIPWEEIKQQNSEA